MTERYNRPVYTATWLLRQRGLSAVLDAARVLVGRYTTQVAPAGIRHPVHLRLPSSDLAVFKDIFLRGDYDLRLPFEPKTIIDAGANVGFASIYFANRYPDARIIAIEPEPDNFHLLEKNVASYAQITPVHAALWGSPGEIQIVDIGDGPWAFQTHQADTNGTPSDSADCVLAVTLEQILAEHDVATVDLLKVDIEGAEVEVFDTSASWIDRVRAIAIETHDRYRPGCSESFERACHGFGPAVECGENLVVIRNSWGDAPAKKMRQAG